MSRRRVVWTLLGLLLAAAAGAAVAGCGRKGPPLRPGEEEPTYRRDVL